MNMIQSERLIGRHFQGVVSSRGLSPDASQDVTKVFPERARIVVADGAGDTGAAAGEWAGVLALCYGTGQDTAKTLEPEWLGRSLHAWNLASNLSRFAARAAVNPQELALLERGVSASFIGAAFVDRSGTLSVNWVAAGDCEAFLFRDGHLQERGPIPHWGDFSSTAQSLNSKSPDHRNLLWCEWQLEEGDVLILCSDALGKFILRFFDDDNRVPNEVQALMRCTEWQDLRQYIEAWRQDGRLQNDDVAIVRVSIHRGKGAGPFSLTQDTGSDARPATASSKSRDETPSELLSEVARKKVSDPTSRGETPSLALDETKVSRPILYSLLLGTFALGLLVGAILSWARVPGYRETDLKPANPTPTVTSQVGSTDDGNHTTEKVATNQPQATSTAPGAEEKRARVPAPASTAKESLRPPSKAQPRENTAPAQIESVKPVAALQIETAAPSPTPVETASTTAPVQGAPSPTPVPVQMPLPAPAQGAPPLVESSAMAAAGASNSPMEAAGREQNQAKTNTSDVGPGPKTEPPCTLSKGTKLYGTAKGEIWPLLLIEASHATCVADYSAPQDSQRVTISVWVNAGRRGAKEPVWLSNGKNLIPQPTVVRTAPQDDPGSEYLGSVRKDTPFVVGKREERKGHVWIELKIAAYISAK